jgi:hypothetical protein
LAEGSRIGLLSVDRRFEAIGLQLKQCSDLSPNLRQFAACLLRFFAWGGGVRLLRPTDGHAAVDHRPEPSLTRSLDDRPYTCASNKEPIMNKVILAIAIALLYSTTAFAQAGFQFAMPGIQAPENDDVKGMRLVFLHGKNQNVSGFDLGFAALSESVNQSGFTFNMGVSQVTGTSEGCACALVNIHSGTDKGFNGAFINIIKSIESGANVGFVNMTEGTSSVDIGGLSMSEKSGTQVGFVNFTEEITGLQIGFLNFAENGFYPMFPFFNYPKK